MLTDLAHHLVADGWDVHIVSSGTEQFADDLSVSVHIHNISMVREPSLLSDLRAFRSWIKLLKDISPDIVFVGTPKASFLGITAAWLSKVPKRLYHLRGLRLETMSGFAFVLHAFIERIVFLLSTQSLAVSGSLRRRAIDLKLVSPDKIVVLGRGSSRGVDTERFRPDHNLSIGRERLGLLEDIPVIGFVGRIAEDKGSRELATASKILHQRGVRHQILVVGPGDEAEAVEQLTDLTGAYKPIFTGSVLDVAPYYGVMDIFCLPTYREGFPNVVLEAGASGVPAVTTDATGAIDSVVDGVTGRIVRAGHPEDLANALEHLILDPPKRTAMGKAGRHHIVQNFSKQIVHEKIIRYLNQTLETL